MRIKLYKPFEHWYHGGTIWVISDTHFDDPDCKLMDVNWVSPEEQVKLINSKVGKNDTLIHLGDVGNKEWVKKLKGYKVLIRGNHDSGSTTYEGIFDEVYGGPLFINEKICLSHEPLGHALSFGLNIHGHVHSLSKEMTNMSNLMMEAGDYKLINMAANICGYTPERLDKLVEGSKTKTIHRERIDSVLESKKRTEEMISKIEKLKRKYGY
ncbi:MAG: metallophosphoesterase [Methanobrevibacter sp.]|nr:metallophosphoesterase [Methanobrevibacter sp.]